MFVHQLMAAAKISSGVTYATWNPADKGANIVLTGGNLSAEGVVSNQSVRDTLSKATGKWYWELTMNSGINGLVGLANGSASLSTALGGAASIGYRANTGQVLQGGSAVANFATYTVGDIVGVAFDATAQTVAFYKNNAPQGTLSTSSLGSTLYPSVGWGLGGFCVFTANFGATALTYSPPAGFNAGLYT